MYYTVITEEYTESRGIRRPMMHNIEVSNFEKLLSVIYSGIDMDGSSEKMRIINLPSKTKGRKTSEAPNIQKTN